MRIYQLPAAAAIATIMTAGAATPAAADTAVALPAISDVRVARADSVVSLSMTVDLAGVEQHTDRQTAYIPVIADADGNSVSLPAVVVAGRNRRIRIERNPALLMPADRLARPGDRVAYAVTTPWQPWMETSTVTLVADQCGCGGTADGSASRPLGTLDYRPRAFVPSYIYLRPAAEAVKERNISGSAFIDFRVNRTDINPDYRRNPEELRKITASIDSIRNDSDITIRSLRIHGYASPEGSYANNTRLAEGRTRALADYVDGLYHFPEGVVKTESTPEDWAGLRRWVEASDIDNRDAILAIIDSSLDPDPRDRKIKTTYPQQYSYLLENVYPALRHSDYDVDFTIRSFTDPAEIRDIAFTNPSKLSLDEFYAAASAMTPGTTDFDRLWAAALTVYPASEVANLNAANAAMASGHLARAAECLARAGSGPEAVYARGILAALEGNYAEAADLLDRAARLHVSDAPAALDQVRALASPSGFIPAP